MRQSERQTKIEEASTSTRGQKSVFRIPNYKSNNHIAHGPVENPTDRVFHSRRSHRKSRGGCASCKQRRVKCDETKPHCLRCQKHGVDCDYTAQLMRTKPPKHVVSHFIESQPDLMSVESLSASMSLLLVAERLDELLKLGHAASGSRLPLRTCSPSSSRILEALRHFNQSAFGMDSTPGKKDNMRPKMTQLAFETPFLMHAIIGVATTHLSNAVPEKNAYRVAEAYHWQQAIRQYSEEVSRGVTQQNMDKLYSTCLLLTVHTFILEEFNPRASFVFSSDPRSLNWLRLQGGLRYLLERTSRWLPNSMWFHAFMETHDPNIDYEDNRPGRVGLDPDFADLCGIDECSTTDNNPYLWPLRMLTWIIPLEMAPKNASKYHNWMGRLESEYYERLWQKDPPALVLLAWWLALAGCAGEWWMETRTRSECTAICMRLEDSEDPLVCKLLEFPAQCCGYLLRHVQERMALEARGDLGLHI
ncbi:C6 transcription factor [Penicillium macrosclerotiorum]|uniref:C6 transcription factor n=1 Tax=Penicillium macrosclerotiorum TaxID=303699 RepID=UPI00254680D8|nr:C6 transcription factor [Penicillium macrosclerotiorum]KAJ5669136.1 C6 transcription factor [Penicillium macrosclerotiorum]